MEINTRYSFAVMALLNKTVRLMGEVDEVIEVHGGWPVK